MAFDSWKNPRGFPTLAISWITPKDDCFIAKFQEVRESETADFLAKELEAIECESAALGVKVIGRMADNARNAQAACAQGKVKSSIFFVFFPGGVGQGFALNCFAHTTNLLLQDLAGLFATQFNQAKQMEAFFRDRYRPRTLYESAMQGTGETHLVQVFIFFIWGFTHVSPTARGYSMGLPGGLLPECPRQPRNNRKRGVCSEKRRVQIQRSRVDVDVEP